jgi:hypothetical protein
MCSYHPMCSKKSNQRDFMIAWTDLKLSLIAQYVISYTIFFVSSSNTNGFITHLFPCNNNFINFSQQRLTISIQHPFSSMKTRTTFAFLLLTTISSAQTKDLATLPSYDCSLKKVMTMIGRQTIIASPDNSKALETMLTEYCGTFGNNCIRKKESELTADDYSKNMLMAGVLADFKNWRLLKTPVLIIPGGFIINNKVFKDKSDGFVYVDTNRIIIGGNSLGAVKDAQLALTGGHDILMVQNGKITWFGNKTDDIHFNWFNLQDLKQTNYDQKKSELFSTIYVSKTYRNSINYPALYTELKTYVQQFLSVYDLTLPVKKVSWFLHSNMQEYGTMSGMFGLTCPGNNSAGFSIRGEIHTNGFDTGLVKHEYSHFLFDNTIPQDNNPAFFVEGCVEYVTNLNDKQLFKKRVAVAKKFKDTLNYAGLIIDNRDFYGQYSAANYSVCGVLVKYIIDKFGTHAFKKYCLAENKKAATKDLFKTDFDTFISSYKSWLDAQ